MPHLGTYTSGGVTYDAHTGLPVDYGSEYSGPKKDYSSENGYSAADLADQRKEDALADLLTSGDKWKNVTDGSGRRVIKEGSGPDITIDSLVGTNDAVSKQIQEAEAAIEQAKQSVISSATSGRSQRNRRSPRYKEPRQGGILRYPLENLTEHTDYLQIDITKYIPVGTPSTLQWQDIGDTFDEVISDVKDGGDGSEAGKKLIAKGVKAYSQHTGTGRRYVGEAGDRRLGAGKRAGRVSTNGLANRPLKNDGTILLPIPSNIQDGNSVSYSESKLNGIQAAAAGMVQGVMSDTKFGEGEASWKAFMENVANTGAQFSEGFGSVDKAKDTILKGLTAKAVGIFGGNVTVEQLMARESGEIFNPNMELLFNGPTLRAFKFQWRLTPRNQKEADQIRLIIRAFKRNMAPKTGNDKFFLKTPNVFELRYRSGLHNHPFLHKFKQCFLTDISVNYTGDGVYSTYDDATPISMILDLSFKELEPIYDIDYDSAEGRGAVGY